VDSDIDSLLRQVVEAADIEVFWEKSATGESGFISSQPYSSGDGVPLMGVERLSRIPADFHRAVSTALAQIGVSVQFPFKHDKWYDHQWFEQCLVRESIDVDGELIRWYC